MSEYAFVLDLINNNEEKNDQNSCNLDNITENKINVPDNDDITLFDLHKFGNELKTHSEIKNKRYIDNVENISAYDIAVNCIRNVVYKLRSTPIKSYADKWLPLSMRSTIGTAIHNYLQSYSSQFTEQEVSLKIPSIRFSGRLDCLINNNVLVEIKSVPFKDYQTIIKKQTPRVNDFYQCMVYKYILENYLSEAKDEKIKIREGTVKPKYDVYDIKYMQFIYVAHDLIASDTEDISESVKMLTALKQSLNSKKNPFYFISALNINTNSCDQYLEYIKTKIQHINYYMDTNKLPPENDPFIDKKCFFCLYNNTCNIKK